MIAATFGSGGPNGMPPAPPMKPAANPVGDGAFQSISLTSSSGVLQRPRRATARAADALAGARVDVHVVEVVVDLPQRVEAELVEPADLGVDDRLLVAARS